MLIFKILLFIYIANAQSEFGSIFSVIDSIPSIELQSNPKVDLVSFSYNNNFNISEIKEFSGIISSKEYHLILSIKSFNMKVFRQSEINLNYFYKLNKLTLGSEFSYKNQWFKGFETIDYYSVSPSIDYVSYINTYISFNNVSWLENNSNSIDLVFGKQIEQTYIQVSLNYARDKNFERITFIQKFDNLNIYFGFQNGENEYLSGLEFRSETLLFRFAYEMFNELGTRTEMGLSYFY